ncbi:hypothetical protein ACFTXJ_14135 [Streptomyces zhihengii]|uniref:hypothetical protein n=1 Tax=Streptomyces zhihengii TaxID=1818004 RepID=UPI00362D8A54
MDDCGVLPVTGSEQFVLWERTGDVIDMRTVPGPRAQESVGLSFPSTVFVEVSYYAE